MAFRLFRPPPFDHRGDQYARDGSTLIVLNHYFTTLVGRLREESNPTEPPSRQRDLACLLVMVIDEYCVISFGEADGNMVHRTSTRSHIPLGPSRVARQFQRRTFDPIYFAHGCAREHDQRRRRGRATARRNA